MSAVLQLLDAKGFHRTVGFCKIFVSFLSLYFLFVFDCYRYSTVEYSIQMEEKTQSLWIPLWPFHVSLLIGLGLMALVAFFKL